MCMCAFVISIGFPIILCGNRWLGCGLLPYGTKILHGIKFYGVGRTVKLKSINFYYCIAKILSCFDNCKI